VRDDPVVFRLSFSTHLSRQFIEQSLAFGTPGNQEEESLQRTTTAILGRFSNTVPCGERN